MGIRSLKVIRLSSTDCVEGLLPPRRRPVHLPTRESPKAAFQFRAVLIPIDVCLSSVSWAAKFISASAALIRDSYQEDLFVARGHERSGWQRRPNGIVECGIHGSRMGGDVAQFYAMYSYRLRQSSGYFTVIRHKTCHACAPGARRLRIVKFFQMESTSGAAVEITF